ncbi:hypothetical protein Pla163_34720 [Planctomycetes bacterium Pla163]|uniref:Uncharacterized protein n=1 Tax=Rohdeia mirabilis TaxID=2528008 RepID=A0A518D4C4_9BACT|nr:hypothetical protein Pla163_34720 [Planctomycetes bacterium Pla163]
MTDTLDPTPAPAARARALLRLLRDLNLSDERVTIAGARTVRIVGCRSLDEPADRVLVYRVRCGEIEYDLELNLHTDGEHGPEVVIRLTPDSPGTDRRVRLVGGADGPVTAPDLLARLDPDAAIAKDAAHFMRRVVRAAFAGPSAA